MISAAMILLIINLSIIVIADLMFSLFTLFIITLVNFECANFILAKKYKTANIEIIYKRENIENISYFNIVAENIIAAVDDTATIDIMVFNNPKRLENVAEYKVIKQGSMELGSCFFVEEKDTRERFLTKALRLFFMRDSQPVEEWG